MGRGSNRGIRFHFVRWYPQRRSPSWVWGFDKWYGYDSTYYGLQLGCVSFQIERTGR